MITDESRRKAAATKRSRTSKRILDAIVQVINTKGLHSWSIEDVAETAGVSTATVYRYYPSKMDLVRAANNHADACLLCGQHLR